MITWKENDRVVKTTIDVASGSTPVGRYWMEKRPFGRSSHRGMVNTHANVDELL